MTERVQGCKAKDTGRDLDGLLNDIAVEHGISAVELLGGAVIAEGVWAEHALREHPWPDVSYGFGQPAVKWFDWRSTSGPVAVRTVQLDGDGTLADVPSNRYYVRQYMWDAERALRYVAPRYAPLRATWGNAVEAWCRWNKPNTPGAANPNRPNYIRSLAEAEQYRAEEEPVAIALVMPVREEFADTPEGLAEFQKSLLEFAVACDLAGDADAGVAALKELNPDRYKDLAPKARA